MKNPCKEHHHLMSIQQKKTPKASEKSGSRTSPTEKSGLVGPADPPNQPMGSRWTKERTCSCLRIEGFIPLHVRTPTNGENEKWLL